MAATAKTIPSQTTMPSHPGIEEIRQWMEEIDPEPEHGLQVTRLALGLFDSLAPLHGMGGRERYLLEAAALLHDVGMSVSDKRHHKNSYELIKNHPFALWSPGEVAVIALVARYHRKAAPSVKHPSFLALPEADREMVRRLAAILRLADGLDRAHLSTVKDLEVEYDPRTVRVKLYADRDCSTEIWGGERKARLFESVFSRRLSLEAVDGYRVRAV